MRWYFFLALGLSVAAWSFPTGCSSPPPGEGSGNETPTENVTDTGAEPVADNNKDAGGTDTAPDKGSPDQGTPDQGGTDKGTPDQGTTDKGSEPANPDKGSEPATPDTSTSDTAAEPTPETTADTIPEGSGGGVPTNGTDLLKYLQAGSYKGWTAESAVHGSTLGSPHGSVRVFINNTLEQSMKAGNTEHPVGAASVKELYQADGTTLRGYAVMVKVTTGTGGNTWYWYEIISGSVVADAVGSGICTGCHASGSDSVRTAYPLK